MTSPSRSPRNPRARSIHVSTALTLLALAGGATLSPSANAKRAHAPAPPVSLETRSPRLSAEAQTIATWAVARRDTQGLPFLIVDKRRATVSAFDAAGRLLGSAPALLGLARGDESVPGIGERKIADIRPHERTTPAGRFAAELGTNTGGEDILWVDYDAAVSMHRVRPVKASEKRLERLASASPADNRISYGCINIPAAFYDRVVKPLFVPKNGIVYVLPETKPLAEVFGDATRTAQR
jgi:hypothetical protein